MFEYYLVGLLISLALAGVVIFIWSALYFASSFLIKGIWKIYKYLDKKIKEINT